MMRTTTKATRCWTAIFAAIFLAIGTAVAPLEGQGLGLSAGANFSDLSDIDAGSVSATSDNSTGYHFGLAFEVGAGPLAIRPGILYQRFGTYSFPSGQEFDLTAIEIPVDLRLSVLPIPAISPYLIGGPVFTFPRGDEDFDDATESVSVTADVGVGLEIGLPGTGLRIMPELRYSIGVTDYMSDSFEVGGTTFTPSEDDQRVANVMLRVHAFF